MSEAVNQMETTFASKIPLISMIGEQRQYLKNIPVWIINSLGEGGINHL